MLKEIGRQIGRRTFCTIAAGGVISSALSTGCRRRGSSLPGAGRLTARPHDTATSSVSGQVKLGLDYERDAILQLPQSKTGPNFSLLLLLHGAGQSADDMFWYLGSAHEQAGVAVLAANSREETWDALTGSFGPDVDFLNRAMDRVFELVPVDPARIAVGGFSDGATYAISIGLINGDLFKRVVGFSPGFIVSGTPQGKPGFFISHGTRDHILPIERCGRRVATYLKSRGYDVTFREFDGDHEMPPDVALEGLQWVASNTAG